MEISKVKCCDFQNSPEDYARVTRVNYFGIEFVIYDCYTVNQGFHNCYDVWWAWAPDLNIRFKINPNFVKFVKYEKFQRKFIDAKVDRFATASSIYELIKK